MVWYGMVCMLMAGMGMHAWYAGGAQAQGVSHHLQHCYGAFVLGPHPRFLREWFLLFAAAAALLGILVLLLLLLNDVELPCERDSKRQPKGNQTGWLRGNEGEEKRA